MLHAVIMAGGVGTRFWPESRRQRPKQLIDLFGGGAMIQQTISRIEPVVPPERRWIVTSHEQMTITQKALPSFLPNRFIFDAMGRNTAPAIGLAAIRLLKDDPDAVMMVFPADHRIEKIADFRKVLLDAANLVENSDMLVTIGIEPTRPETGYGYIQVDHSVPAVADGIFRVKTFAEKPNRETAEIFLASREFLWNSGIFIWRADAILQQIAEHIPHWYRGLQEISSAIGAPQEEDVIWQVFSSRKGISIDYAVMEHAPNVAVVRGTFGWSDVGSWDEVWRLSDHDSDGNARRGRTLTVNAKENLIHARERLIVVMGVDGLAVIDAGDAILVCPREKSQEVRAVVEAIEKAGKEDYL